MSGSSRLPRLGRREHHRELHQRPRPDRQREENENLLRRHLLVFERVEELYDVRRGTWGRDVIVLYGSVV